MAVLIMMSYFQPLLNSFKKLVKMKGWFEATRSMMIRCSSYPDEIIVDRVVIMEEKPSYQLNYEGPISECMKNKMTKKMCLMFDRVQLQILISK